MKTDFIVTITTGRTPAPKTTTGHHETYEAALEEAHIYMRHELMSPSVITVWARQGNHVWPVRILYPNTKGSTSSSAYGLPVPCPNTYMVETQHPQHPVLIPTEKVS